MAQAAEKIEQAPVAPLPANSVEWNGDGFVWREAIVRLPENVGLADLYDTPEIWRTVQQNPLHALRRLDRLFIVSHDEAWGAECRVADADSRTVTLAKPVKMDLHTRSGESWTDGTYEARWDLKGYAVFRVGDGVRMLPDSFRTIEAAKAGALRHLYPRNVNER